MLESELSEPEQDWFFMKIKIVRVRGSGTIAAGAIVTAVRRRHGFPFVYKNRGPLSRNRV